MSMKRCFELSAGPSLSAVSRALVIGGALSLVVACGRKDAANSDSTAAASNSATTSTTAMATPSATPVESVSTGETSTSADSQKNRSTASASRASGAADTSSKSASAKTAATPTHHTVHHSDSTKAKHATASPAHTSSSSSSTGTAATTASSTTSSTTPTSSASTSSSTSADTGQKTAADTSKKTASASGAVDHLLVSPQEYEGWKMFSVYCYRCHGVDAMGGGIAPNLRHSVSSEGSVTHEVFVQTVTNGRLAKGMPTWKALLSPEQIEDLWLYINARSSGRLAPGRPHMAQGANP
jgi:mono/diheme cytochrome c family protein